jgi:hypothetical protein
MFATLFVVNEKVNYTEMNARIVKLQTAIEPFRDQIINHEVYSRINTLGDLRIFMRYHVYAVWDFMSLLKALQIQLTCTSIPWFPVGSGTTRSLINEIVAGEESDLDVNGIKKSHYEMYLDAMEQCGAETTEISAFIDTLQSTGDLKQAFYTAGTPPAAEKFVSFTFELATGKKPHLQASAFTFGREDLIPGMFHTMVSDLNSKFPNQLSFYKYYLDRHIEVDGDHHSHLALAMTAELCGDDDQLWKEAEMAAIRSLQQRIHLWDAALEAIECSRIEEVATAKAPSLQV